MKASVIPNTYYKITFISAKENNLQAEILEDKHFGKINITKFRQYAINYFNGDNEFITISYISDSDCHIHLKPQHLRIQQIYMNDILSIAFLDNMKNVFKLEQYHDDNAPAFFYGIMNDNDLKILEKNKSLKIIIWIGGDINYSVHRSKYEKDNILKKINKIKQMTKTVHIAISSFIKKDLVNLSINHKYIPFMGIDFSRYKPVTKGPCIYLYTSLQSEIYYGEPLYTLLMKKYKNIKFIVTCCKYYYDLCIKSKHPLKYGINYYPPNELTTKIYPQCFIGLRLTDHDGLAASVQELGLLGIKSIHNGQTPSSLNYKSFEDICAHIDNEIKTIGTIDEDLAISVKKYLTISDNFFETNFYQK